MTTFQSHHRRPPLLPDLHRIKDGEPEATQPEATSSEEADTRRSVTPFFRLVVHKLSRPPPADTSGSQWSACALLVHFES